MICSDSRSAIVTGVWFDFVSMFSFVLKYESVRFPAAYAASVATARRSFNAGSPMPVRLTAGALSVSSSAVYAVNVRRFRGSIFLRMMIAGATLFLATWLISYCYAFRIGLVMRSRANDVPGLSIFQLYWRRGFLRVETVHGTAGLAWATPLQEDDPPYQPNPGLLWQTFRAQLATLDFTGSGTTPVLGHLGLYWTNYHDVEVTGAPPIYQRYALDMPGAFPVLPFCALLIPPFYRRHLRARRQRRGLCPNCGYDLRASRDVCPECGSAISSPTAAQVPPSAPS
jgi:hypothetical protein